MELRGWRQLPPVTPIPEKRPEEYDRGFKKAYEDLFYLLSFNPELRDEVSLFCARQIKKLEEEGAGESKETKTDDSQRERPRSRLECPEE